MTASVTYLHHSGFLVSDGRMQLMFDCITPEDEAVVSALHAGLPVIALASHAHGDHFDKRILGWQRPGQVELVLGRDIRKGYPASYMKQGDSLELMGARISAFGSTDQGVSFCVRMPGGLSVFHAGDLNDWHWRAESTPGEAKDAHNRFMKVLGTLPTGVDIAMFPVDPRMGEGHDEGARSYIGRVHPRLLFPMHWWEQPDCARAFAQLPFEGTQVVALTERGQTYAANLTQ